MNGCDISFIIPHYNDLENIEKAINSILNQKTNLILEIIVINNGDFKRNKNFVSLIEKFKCYQQVKILNCKRKGASNARNVGIKNAKGNYLMFVDSDDYLEKNILKKLENDIKINKFDILKFSANRIENEKIIGNIKGFNAISFSGSNFLMKLLNNEERIFSPIWLYCIKKEIFTKNKIYFKIDKYHEDYRITTELILNSKKIKSYNFIGYNYIHRKGSITRTSNYQIIRKKSFDFLQHSEELLYLSQKYLKKNEFKKYRSYVIEQTERKYKYLEKYDKLKFLKLLNKIKLKYNFIDLSIIIPIYNSEKTIIRCINSIKKQEMINYELILVNDGSSDSSSKIILKFKKNNRIKIYNFEKNVGQSKARNFGIKISNGRYIMFVDSDDTIEKNCFRKIIDKIILHKADIYYTNQFYKINSEKKLKDLNFEINPTKNYILGSPAPHSKIIKKELCHFFPNFKRYEDLSIMPFYALKTAKIHNLNFPYYNYYKTKNSIMHKSNYNYQYMIKALDFLFNKINKEKNYFLYKAEYDFLIIKNIIYFSLLRSSFLEKEIQYFLFELEYLESIIPDWNLNHYLYKQDKNFIKYVNLLNENRNKAIEFFKNTEVKIK